MQRLLYILLLFCCFTNTEAQTYVTPYEYFVRGLVYEQDSCNYARALDLYAKAADGGDTRAMNNLAVLYAFGYGTDENPEKAVALLRRAAFLGDAFAMENYGTCMMLGYGMDKDEKAAVPWFKRAEDAGYWDLCDPYTYRILIVKDKYDIIEGGLQFVIYTENDLLPNL